MNQHGGQIVTFDDNSRTRSEEILSHNEDIISSSAVSMKSQKDVYLDEDDGDDNHDPDTFMKLLLSKAKAKRLIVLDASTTSSNR